MFRCSYLGHAVNLDTQSGDGKDQANPRPATGEQDQMQQSESKKRKENGEDLVEVRATKLKMAEPQIEGMQDVKTQYSAEQVTSGPMTSQNRQVPLLTTEFAIGANNVPVGVCDLAESPPICGVEWNFQGSETTMNRATCISESSIDALNLLQCYASGSQASPDTTVQHALAHEHPNVAPEQELPSAAPAPRQNNISLDQTQGVATRETPVSGKSYGKSKKSVTFADEVNDPSAMIAKIGRNNALESTCIASKEITGTPVDRVEKDTLEGSPVSMRRVTRSMSPFKPPAPLKSAAPSYMGSPLRKKGLGPNDAGTNMTNSPRRSSRLATAEGRTDVNNPSLHSANSTRTDQDWVDIDQAKLASSLQKNSMSRKLEQDFASAQVETETLEQRNRRELIEDCPSFSPGIDGTDHEGDNCAEAKDEDTVVDEVVIVSSNEDSGDSLDEIYANIEMPTKAPESEKGGPVQPVPDSPKNPNSYTPVPQAHNKRVVKPTNAQKSPYTNVENKLVVNKFITEVYNRICQYGAKNKTLVNRDKIIDYGSFFVLLWDLADAIKPGEWLSNSVCEAALHVLAQEMAPQKKHVMPLRIATKLRNALCIHDKTVKTTFKWSPENRLDHNEQATSNPKEVTMSGPGGNTCKNSLLVYRFCGRLHFVH